MISPRSPHNRPVESNLATARAALVSSLVGTRIRPHLQTAALSGLSSTTLIMVPSNVSALQPSPGSNKDSTSTFPGEKVVSLPSSENPTVIRLGEQENSLEFLRQPAVLQTMTDQLCRYLDGEGYQKIAVELGKVWSHAGGLLLVSEQEAEGADAALRVEVKTVSLRVESDMGLYETRSGKCLIVKLEVRG